MKSKNELNPLVKEIFILIISSLILTLAINYGKIDASFSEGFITFIIILFANWGIKKLVANYFAISINVKPWEIRYFGFKEKNQFKKPLTMIWWPLLMSLITMGGLWWLPILEFDVKAKPERVARKKGLEYRYAQITENHTAYIVFWSIIATLGLGLIGLSLHFNNFSKISFYYALWSLLPLSRLDGSKLFFGKKWLWFFTLLLTCIVGIFLI